MDQSGEPLPRTWALVRFTQFVGSRWYNVVEKVVPSGTLSISAGLVRGFRVPNA